MNLDVASSLNKILMVMGSSMAAMVVWEPQIKPFVMPIPGTLSTVNLAAGRVTRMMMATDTIIGLISARVVSQMN